jgi:hypothetical protein
LLSLPIGKGKISVKSPHYFHTLLFLLLFFLLPSISVAQLKSEKREPLKPPPASIVLEEIPIKPEKKTLKRLLCNECEECVKESRRWHFDLGEMKAIVDRCGADYMLLRYDRKFIDKDGEFIARFNFSCREDRIDLDSIELLQKLNNGDIKVWTMTTTASLAPSIPLPMPVALASSPSQAHFLNIDAIAKHSTSFESKIARSPDNRYSLYFRMGEKAWLAMEKGIISTEWLWSKSLVDKPLPAFMVGYNGENPSMEGSCFSGQPGSIAIKNIFVDYPLNLCRIALEITSPSPLKKAFFSTTRIIDSIAFDGERSIRLMKMLSVDTSAHHVLLEITDIYGTTTIKKIAVYDSLRQYHAKQDTSRRLYRLKDSLASRSVALKAVYFASKFDGNPLTPLLRDYYDWLARKTMREGGIVQFIPSSHDSLICLPLPGKIENVRKQRKYFVQSNVRLQPCSPSSLKHTRSAPCLFSKSFTGILSFAIPLTDEKSVPTLQFKPTMTGQQTNDDSAGCLLFSCFDARYISDSLEIIELPGEAKISKKMNFYVVLSDWPHETKSITMTYIVTFADNEETTLQKLVTTHELSRDQSINFKYGKMDSKMITKGSGSNRTVIVEKNKVVSSVNILKIDIFAFDNQSHQTIGVSSVWYIP